VIVRSQRNVALLNIEAIAVGAQDPDVSAVQRNLKQRAQLPAQPRDGTVEVLLETLF
jgi:peptidoglycan hydrolase-like protein with peptidoglycan-binding domain